MIRPDLEKWNQSADDLRRRSTEAAHVRTRERFLALYLIATGQTNATAWAEQTGRCDECILGWVHAYNERGPSVGTSGRAAAPPFYPGRRPTSGRSRHHHRTQRPRPPGARLDAQKAPAVGERPVT